jgi:hypothetical protein
MRAKFSDRRAAISAAFAEPSSGLETEIPSLTMSQDTAMLFSFLEHFLGASDLRPVATGYDRWAR